MITLNDVVNDPTILEKLRNQNIVGEASTKEDTVYEYYDQLGELVERYPIVWAGIRRG